MGKVMLFNSAFFLQSFSTVGHPKFVFPLWVPQLQQGCCLDPTRNVTTYIAILVVGPNSQFSSSYMVGRRYDPVTLHSGKKD